MPLIPLMPLITDLNLTALTFKQGMVRLLGVAALAYAPLSLGQTLHKWVDAHGIVTYSDLPPQSTQTVKNLTDTLNAMGAGVAQNEPLNYETAQLVNQAPIVLYTNKGCTPCDFGRTFLQKKGYPFTEKTVNSNADLVALGALFEVKGLPILAVGKQNLSGYGATQWDDLISSAGYGATTLVPQTYQNGAVSSLSPEPIKPKKTKGVVNTSNGDNGDNSDTESTNHTNTTDDNITDEKPRQRHKAKPVPPAAPEVEPVIRF